MPTITKWDEGKRTRRPTTAAEERGKTESRKRQSANEIQYEGEKTKTNLVKDQKKEVHNTLKIGQLKVGRLTNTKHTFLEEAANKHQVDVLCLQEVKRRTDPGDRDMPIDGYDGPHRCPCTREKAHENEVSTCLGLAIYFRKTSTLTHTYVASDTTQEGVHYQSVMLSSNGTKEISFYNVYRSPSLPSFGFQLPAATTPSGNLMLVGDFNVVAGIQET